MRRPDIWLWRIGAALLAAAIGIVLALVSARRTAPDFATVTLPTNGLPALDDVAPFALTDAAGAPVDLARLRGKLWTANLFFTTCQSICPPLTRNLAKLQRNVGDAAPFEILSVSVDPAHDTPPVLAAYAATFGADTSRWHFATGASTAVQAFAATSLHLGAPSEPIEHSPYVVLIDRAARIRGYYDGLDTAALERLAADLRTLAAEPAPAAP